MTCAKNDLRLLKLAQVFPFQLQDLVLCVASDYMGELAILESAKLGESSNNFGIYFMNGNICIIVNLTLAVQLSLALVVLVVVWFYLHKPQPCVAVPVEEQDEDLGPFAQEVREPSMESSSTWVTSDCRVGKKARLVWASKSFKKYHTACDCPGFNAAIKKDIICLMPCERAGCAFDNPI